MAGDKQAEPEITITPAENNGADLMFKSPLIVVSNRLPFVLKRNSSGQLERMAR